MSRSGDFPILTVVSSAVRIFVSLATLITFFVGWKFIQASSHVTKVEPITIDRGFDYDVVIAEYIDKGRTLPDEAEGAITLYRLSSAEEKSQWFWQAGPFRFYACPGSSQGWDSLLGIVEPEVIILHTDEIQMDLWERAKYGIFWYSQALTQAKRRRLNIARNAFESGVPHPACSISLALAIDGRLNEEELSFAVEALKRGGYIAVSLSVHNDSNAAATQVKVSGPEGFQCMYPEPRQGSQCGPFDLRIDEEQPLLFRADEPALFAQESDFELAAMFKPEWDRWEGPDKPRILCLVVLAATITATIVVLDFLRKALAQTWGKIFFGIACAILLGLIVAFICKFLPLAI